MVAAEMWSENVEKNIESRMFNDENTEMPMSMFISDLPNLHQFSSNNCVRLLETMAETESKELFENAALRAIVEKNFPVIKDTIVKKLFFPYILFVLAFMAYSTYIFERLAALEAKESSPEVNAEIEQISIIKQIAKIIVLVLAFYFLFLESVQVGLQGMGKYLSSPWNYLDFVPPIAISLAMIAEYFVSDMSEGARAAFREYERPINAICGLLTWLKFLYFFRIFRQTGHFIAMLVQVLSDMKVFMAVFTITLIAFAQAFLLLSNNNTACINPDKDGVFENADACLMEDGENPAQFISGGFFGSLLFAYNMSLGAFDSALLGKTYYLMAAILFFLATLFLCVIMLNLLIAVISETYVTVQESQMNTMYQTMCDLIVENKHLASKSNLAALDQEGSYMYLAKVDEADLMADSWKKAAANLRKTIDVKVGQIERNLYDFSLHIKETAAEGKVEFS